MVGMTRAHIADPHIVRKIMEGREDQIRPCVGATYCLDRIYEGGEALCIHNAATGREATIPHVIRKADGPARKVVVVGAGAAGLEAARVAAERGHAVTVLEASGQAGGQILLAARNPRRKELIGIVDWRLAELERLGSPSTTTSVPRRTTCWRWRRMWWSSPRAGCRRTLCSKAAATSLRRAGISSPGNVKPAEDVLLFDDNGAHPGMTAAEMIANAGSRLEMVSPERFFAPEMGGLNHVPYMRAFHEKDVTGHDQYPAALRPPRRQRAGRVLGSDFADGWRAERRVDQVVVEHGTQPLDDLYFELKPLSRNAAKWTTRGWSMAGRFFRKRGRTPVSCCSASVTLFPRATSMPPSMTGYVSQSRV